MAASHFSSCYFTYLIIFSQVQKILQWFWCHFKAETFELYLCEVIEIAWMATELCYFQQAKVRVAVVVAHVVMVHSVQTLWGSSISWYQLTKKCTFLLILYLLPWIWYQNEEFNMVYEFETVEFYEFETVEFNHLGPTHYLDTLNWFALQIYSTLSYMALYRTCQNARKLIYSITFFFFFSPILVKVYIFWKEIWQRIQICHWFCSRM